MALATSARDPGRGTRREDTRVAVQTDHALDQARAQLRAALEASPPWAVDLYHAEIAYLAAVIDAQDACGGP